MPIIFKSIITILLLAVSTLIPIKGAGNSFEFYGTEAMAIQVTKSTIDTNLFQVCQDRWKGLIVETSIQYQQPFKCQTRDLLWGAKEWACEGTGTALCETFPKLPEPDPNNP